MGDGMINLITRLLDRYGLFDYLVSVLGVSVRVAAFGSVTPAVIRLLHWTRYKHSLMYIH